MRFIVNDRSVELEIDPRTSVLDLLRDHLGLTGTKKGCDQGACGACTVLADGERINACLALAMQYHDRRIVTVEGLGSINDLHPLQQSFISHDGFQCGYCTPGQICSAVGMRSEMQRGIPSAVSSDLAVTSINPTDDELRERMSGNLCRCGAHNGIIDAVRDMLTSGERP